MNSKRYGYIGIAALALLAAACGRPDAMESVAVGQDVVLVKADGGVVEGKVTGRDEDTVHLSTGTTTRTVPADDIVDVRVVTATAPVDLPPAARFREYTIPAGTSLSLRLATAINSGTNSVEDPIEATLSQGVRVGDAEVLPAGSVVAGMISAVDGSARVKGLASIRVDFATITAAGHDARYDIEATYAETAEPTKAVDAAKIGIGAGAGSVVGSLLGGKRGAATGAAIGGGTGTAAVLMTSGKEVAHAAGTTLTVSLKQPVDVRVPIESAIRP